MLIGKLAQGMFQAVEPFDGSLSQQRILKFLVLTCAKTGKIVYHLPPLELSVILLPTTEL